MTFLLCAAPTHAQSVMDGSDADIASNLRDTMMAAVIRGQNDPYGAQLRDLSQVMSFWGQPAICGYANFRNRQGGYDGFEAFYWIEGLSGAIFPGRRSMGAFYLRILGMSGCASILGYADRVDVHMQDEEVRDWWAEQRASE